MLISNRRPRFRGLLAATLTATATLVTCGLFLPSASADAANPLVIDAGSIIRPVTHVGAGGLYALADSSTPDPSMLPPLHLKQLTQPAPGVTQLGNGATTPTGDALKVANSMISAGAQETVRMPDIYPNFPYQWVSWDDWLSKVDTMVQARVAANTTTNINGWELWNEPDGTWNTSAAGPYNDGWTRTYNEVRKYDTVTPIVGPSISSYNHDFMLSFLTSAKANNTVPDVISWHLWNSDALPSEIVDLHGIEDSLGLGRLPISINEYAWPDQVDVPSGSLRYLATFERATDVRDAERAYWFESGTLNGLLYNNKPTSTYWLYKWYGDMTGNMISVAQNGSQDGVASLDGTRKVLDAIVGGASGDQTVSVQNLNGFGSNAQVSLSYTPASGRLANTATPTSLWTRTLPITNGTVTVPITGQNAQGAYNIVVTPATGPTTSYQQTYEAENASVVNGHIVTSSSASNGAYVAGLDNSGDARNDSFVDFIVNAPVTGDYNLSIRYANGTGANSTQGLAYDGGGWNTVTYPPTAGWGQFASVDGPTLHLSQGYNTIRLAKGSPYFSGGIGYAELDSITLTSQSAVPTPPVAAPATFVTRVEAETSTVSDGHIYPSTNASAGSFVGGLDNADSFVQFPVTVPVAGTYKLTVGYANGGAFTQNGTTDATNSLSVNGETSSELTFPATGAWGLNGGSFDAAVSTTVTLAAGSNTIRLSHDPNANYAELDYVQLSSPADAVVDGRTTQAITFPTVSGLTVGGSDVPLNATSSSGLPVSYTASGACSIVSGALHAVSTGSCTVEADQSGNASFDPAPTATQTVSVAAAPVVASAVTAAGSPVNGWYTSQVSVTLSTTSTGTKIQYQIDGGTWKIYSSAFTISADGSHTVTDRLLKNNVVVDNSTGSFGVKIDKTAPAVTGTRTPAATGSPRNPVTVLLSATDASSGVASTQYQVNSGAWTIGDPANPLVLSTVGNYVVAYRAIDNAGNVSAAKSLTVTINADPVTKVSASAKSVSAGGYITFSLAGYHRFSVVTIMLGSQSLGTVTTDVNGAGKATVPVPATTTAGTYAVAANEQGSHLTSSVSLKVVS